MTHTQTQGADGAGTKTAATAWLLKRLKAARSDSEAHPEGHSNRTFYAGQAIAYENVLSLLEDEESTPAPAATPGVPDSLREAFAAATDSPVFVHDFADPAVSSAPGCQDVSLSFVTPDHITAAFMGNGLAGTIDQARKDAVALAAAWNHVRALIAAQPAGQACVPDSLRALSEKIKSATLYARKGGFTRSTLFLTDEESNCILAALITTHPAAQNAATGAGPCEDDITSAMIQAGRYAANLNDGTLARIYLAMRTVEWEEARAGDKHSETALAASPIAELKPCPWEEPHLCCYPDCSCAKDREPAPNSTRTGAAETEDAPGLLDQVSSEQAEAFERTARNLTNLYAPDGPPALQQGILAALLRTHIAARPEAPSDAGWSREDLEAFVAREWPEGRSAGAAARELVRALSVRGLAPTLQRLLTDLLGQINFASTDRAQILADFANAAPEAARMAKIDSFERWNPHVFDPTPPSDPAPSGQADTFPKPRRKDGEPPCGECHLHAGETCDICGAVAPPAPSGQAEG